VREITQECTGNKTNAIKLANSESPKTNYTTKETDVMLQGYNVNTFWRRK